jgi:CBS domain-containing protein
MSTMMDILAQKGTGVHVIAPRATVREAVAAMCTHRIGALLVRIEGGTVGIFTERDVLNRVVLEGRNPIDTRVEDVMTRELLYVRSTRPVEDAMAIMIEYRCRHLPIIDDGCLRGLVSMGDLVRAVTKDQKSEIRLLTDYIAGAFV